MSKARNVLFQWTAVTWRVALREQCPVQVCCAVWRVQWPVKKLAALADGPTLCTFLGKGWQGKQTMKHCAIVHVTRSEPSTWTFRRPKVLRPLYRFSFHEHSHFLCPVLYVICIISLKNFKAKILILGSHSGDGVILGLLGCNNV
jgi:hypothetical protein